MGFEEKMQELDALYLAAMKLTEHCEHGNALGCTDWHAIWCPVHGDCTCDKTFGRKLVLIDGTTAKCPLHGELHYSHNREGVRDTGWVRIAPGPVPGTARKAVREANCQHEFEDITSIGDLARARLCVKCGWTNRPKVPRGTGSQGPS